MTTVLETRSLNKHFGGIVVASDINFQLFAGSVVGLVGPNGAGKSSLINLICGTFPADSGEVLINDVAISSWRPHRRARAGIARTWQHVRLFPTLSILDNLMIAQRNYWGENPLSAFRNTEAAERQLRELAFRQLERVKLVDMADRLPNELSIGKQKLASLARALMNQGKCLLLDEPVAGVEGGAYDALKTVIREEANNGRAICIVEHNISFIADLCDDCAFMFNGAIISRGSIDSLINDEHLTELYFGTSK